MNIFKTTNNLFNVCVYGSASDNLWTDYQIRSARELGANLALGGWNLITGACNHGLVGECIRAFAETREWINTEWWPNQWSLGVSTELYSQCEECCSGCDEIIVSPYVDKRKKIMLEKSHLFVVLPGGVGTLDELARTMLDFQERARTEEDHRRIFIDNTSGHYDFLIHYIQDLSDNDLKKRITVLESYMHDPWEALFND